MIDLGSAINIYQGVRYRQVQTNNSGTRCRSKAMACLVQDLGIRVMLRGRVDSELILVLAGSILSRALVLQGRIVGIHSAWK